MSCSRPHYRFPARPLEQELGVTRARATQPQSHRAQPRSSSRTRATADTRRHQPQPRRPRPVSDISIPATRSTRSEHMCERAARTCARYHQAYKQDHATRRNRSTRGGNSVGHHQRYHQYCGCNTVSPAVINTGRIVLEREQDWTSIAFRLCARGARGSWTCCLRTLRGGQP
jgi:hypothetical protein